GIDNGGKVLTASLTDAPLTHEFKPALLGGVEIVKGQGRQGPLTFVPYYAWNNRGVGEMAVWVSASARPQSSADFGGTSPRVGTRSMALTFDDLPKSTGMEDIESARRTTESILRVLKAHKAP